MANWTTINESTVRTGKIVIFLETVLSIAAGNGDADPLPEMIADVVATIRAAVSTGNTLDVDPTKIPNSLKGLALRLVARRLKDYIQQPLTTDELALAKDDSGYLNRIMDNKTRFETPDTPSGSAEMQAGGTIEMGRTSKETIGSIPGADRRRVSSRDRLKNL